MSEISLPPIEWRSAIDISLTRLEEKLAHLQKGAEQQFSSLQKTVDLMNVKLNDSIHDRVSTLEYQMKSFQSLKKWLSGIVSALLVASVLNYFATSNRTETLENKYSKSEKQISALEQKIELLQQELKKH